eukprot:CAMPEP_0179123586 /NCGR_PEP_ID=MMETSP0796-20121207/58370_1 /TAXON_ID=73915 /ORGANISM="Pyrodinium bahamense, Strain pbaha01" /LENGTH=159 /DNA_ID=CAMNT_0020822229 /DNA_START=265 /DNA_END=741 /DNA_ORIENTATION=+
MHVAQSRKLMGGCTALLDGLLLARGEELDVATAQVRSVLDADRAVGQLLVREARPSLPRDPALGIPPDGDVLRRHVEAVEEPGEVLLRGTERDAPHPHVRGNGSILLRHCAAGAADGLLLVRGEELDVATSQVRSVLEADRASGRLLVREARPSLPRDP